MKLCHSKPFILGTPKAGTTKPSIHFSTCLHNTLRDPRATLNTGYRALRWRNLQKDLGKQLEVIVPLTQLSQRAYIYRKKKKKPFCCIQCLVFLTQGLSLTLVTLNG